MKKKVKLFIIACYLTIILILSSCKSNSNIQPEQTAVLSHSIQYISKDGKVFTAKYGSLEDDTLNFVKITMPDGKQYTLPQVVSASGVRFTDEREIQWWLHQNSVRIDVRDSNGKWQTLYPDLKEIK